MNEAFTQLIKNDLFYFIYTNMINQGLSKEARQDFDIVVNVARSIGLADNPPFQSSELTIFDSFVRSAPCKGHRTRKFTQSDMLLKQEKKRRVKQRSQQLDSQYEKQPPNSARKGSIKDVFIDRLKPQNNPIQYMQTQKVIYRNELDRASKYAKDAQIVLQLSGHKKRRSTLLKQLAEEIPPEKTTPKNKIVNMSPARRFYGERNLRKTQVSKTISFDKLAKSLDFSKFLLVSKVGGVVGLLSQEGCHERRTQTARSGKRWVSMHFNSNNKAEIIYPRQDSQQDLFVH